MRKVSFGIFSAFAALVVFGFMVSCKPRTRKALSDKEMVSVLADMHLAQAYAESELWGHDADSLRQAIAAGVLARHGVTQEELDSSYVYYGKNLDEFAELYAKVDKNLEKRKNKMSEDGDVQKEDAGTGLWPYSSHGVLTELSPYDSWVFSIADPEIEKGGSVEWKMHFVSGENMFGVLGVDYSDGTGEASSTNLMGRNEVSLKIQTDSSKSVTRLYGTMRLKEETAMPLFADSISLRVMPFDSLEYRKYHNQRKYKPLGRKPAPITKDSVKREGAKDVEMDYRGTGVTPHKAIKQGKAEGANKATAKQERKADNRHVPVIEAPEKPRRINPKDRIRKQ